MWGRRYRSVGGTLQANNAALAIRTSMKLRLVLLPPLLVAAYLVLRRGEPRIHAPDVAPDHADQHAGVANRAPARSIADEPNRAPAERRNLWSFFITGDGLWVWRVCYPDGSEACAENSFSTFAACKVDAQGHGYIAVSAAAERRRAPDGADR